MAVYHCYVGCVELVLVAQEHYLNLWLYWTGLLLSQFRDFSCHLSSVPAVLLAMLMAGAASDQANVVAFT
jgi:hypothetical protein